jgi:toxin ParE1/3/4
VTQVELTSAALAEFAELVAFYDGQGTDLARDFVAEVEQSIERIAEFPDAGAPYESGARRLVLRRFPVVVIYRARESKVEVVALAHQRRRPDYWILREMPPIYSAGAASGEVERIELTMDSTTGPSPYMRDDVLASARGLGVNRSVAELLDAPSHLLSPRQLDLALLRERREKRLRKNRGY